MTDRESAEPSSPGDRNHVLRDSVRGVDQSSVMGVELVAGTLLWMGVGWLVDQWLGTMPWFMAGGALMGNAAGLYLVWVRSTRHERESATPTRHTPGAGQPVQAADDEAQGGETSGEQ